jgi:hypothetical protein
MLVQGVGAATATLMVVKAVGYQATALEQWQNSFGTVMATIFATGEFKAPLAPPYNAFSTTTTANAQQTILAVSAGSAWTLTLPAASGIQAGHEYVIKKTDNNSNAITVTAAGSDKIDGNATYALSAQYKYLRINSDGAANWMITGSN